MSVYSHLRFSHITYSHTKTEKPDQRHFERHCHEYFELLYVVRGEGKYVVEGVEYPMQPNTLLLIRPYEFHYVCPNRDSLYDRYLIHFDVQAPIDAAADLSILRYEGNQKHGIYFSSDNQTDRVGEELGDMEQWLQELVGISRSAEKQNTFLRASLSRMLLWLSLAEQQESTTDTEDVVSRLIEYLNLHLTRDDSLDKLAQRFFVSKYYLCHVFRKQTGVSIFTYITTKRIAMAQQLLATGEPATSVAYQVGFRNYSSFYRAYCKLTGTAPVHRREEIKKGAEEMEIRLACPEDLKAIMQIYADARAFMRENGNPGQWGDNYPPEEMIREDVAGRKSYVCEADGELLGVFYYHEGEDSTYKVIENGKWLNDRPYGVIHRIASTRSRRGVAAFCFAWAAEQCGNLKIDTHRDNIPMQRSLAKNGFTRCGIIHLENGEERIAYQKSTH